MPTVSHALLRFLAATVWYIGGGVLLWKGSDWLTQASAMAESPARTVAWPALGAAAGIGVGLLRGRTMFTRACRRNLARIDALRQPRPWQFYRAGFFVALAAMMAGGWLLSELAQRGYWERVVVGGLELVIATALLTSSVVFWRWRGQASGEASGEGSEGGPRPARSGGGSVGGQVRSADSPVGGPVRSEGAADGG